MTESNNTFEYHPGDMETEDRYRPNADHDFRVLLRPKRNYLNDTYLRLYGPTWLNGTLSRYLQKTNTTNCYVLSSFRPTALKYPTVRQDRAENIPC